MKTKDYVVTAIDHLAEVLKILARIYYDNDAQAMTNLSASITRLDAAMSALVKAYTLEHEK